MELAVKIAVTVQKTDKDEQIDPRFGRAANFCIYDTDTAEFVFIPNSQSLESVSGAGIQAAKTVINQGVGALLTGHCGPKAFRALKAAKVDIYTNVSGSVSESIELFQQQKLLKTETADVEGHW